MSQPSHDPDAAARRLQAEADLCVKCGLCLPHCPTYGQTQHEGDSPRGRIALVQGLGSGLVPASPALQAHLDGCLSCRKCEVVCPARVPYSRILDAGRAQLVQAQPQRARLVRLLALLLVPRPARALWRGLIGLYRASGVQKLVRRYALLGRGPLARLESLLPTASTARRFTSPPAGAGAGAECVAVFRGCVTDIVERDVLDAGETLLRAAGYRVVAAPGQTCCGALYQHAGLAQDAQRLAQRNLAAFDADCGVVSCTSGCGATLRDYAGFDLPGGVEFAARVQELYDWLLPRLDRLRFRPLPLRAALHLPCTLSNVMHGDAALRRLLAAVPQLEIVDLDPAQRCCGAAGSHFVTHPEAADALLAPKLDAVERLKPDLILSSNVGCSLHLCGGLSRSGRPAVPVRHPALLLAQQLDWPATPA